MSVKNKNDHLKFPSGISVRRAKAFAKKLSKNQDIPLHKAQQVIAAENGIDLPWSQAINLIEKAQGGTVLRAPDGTMLPSEPFPYSDKNDHNNIVLGTTGKTKSIFDDHPKYAPFVFKSHGIDSLLAREVLGWVQHAGDERRAWFDQKGVIQRAAWQSDNLPYVMDAYLDDPWWDVCAFQPSSNGNIFKHIAPMLLGLGYTFKLADDGVTVEGWYQDKLVAINELAERCHLVSDEFLACRIMVATAIAVSVDVEKWDRFIGEWSFHFDIGFHNNHRGII